MTENLTRLIVGAVLEALPPTVAKSLIQRSEFTARYGITTKVTVILGGNIEFDRAALFEAVREFIASGFARSSLADISQQSWALCVTTRESPKTIYLEREQTRIGIPAAWSFYENRLDRVNGLDQAMKEVFLGNGKYDYWRKVLTDRIVRDEEHENLCRDLDLTVVGVSGAIARSFESGQGEVGVLVPNSELYLQQLVGRIPEDQDLETYVRTTAAEFIDRLSVWNPVEGIKHALLLSAHGSISRHISLEKLNDKQLSDILEWVRYRGDFISKLAMIEVGLGCPTKRDGLVETIECLIEEILLDDPESDSSRFACLSNLVIFVSGELARAKITPSAPPYWRRLSNIAHASLIERIGLSRDVDMDVFVKSLQGVGRGAPFYIKSLLDLRVEPRWLPDLMTAKQLKAEFIGRISNAAATRSQVACSPKLDRILFEKGSNTVSSSVEFPFPFLPGPLEGGVASVTDLPIEMLKSIEAKLDAKTLQPNSFAGLVNSSLIYRVGPDLARLAATALRKMKYQITEGGETANTHTLISGLATVAAVTRSFELAQEVRILSRVTRRTSKDVSAQSELAIAFVAAAARSDILDWSAFVGDWAFELSLELSDRIEGRAVLSMLHAAVNFEPTLLMSCSKAISALTLHVKH